MIQLSPMIAEKSKMFLDQLFIPASETYASKVIMCEHFGETMSVPTTHQAKAVLQISLGLRMPTCCGKRLADGEMEHTEFERVFAATHLLQKTEATLYSVI